MSPPRPSGTIRRPSLLTILVALSAQGSPGQAVVPVELMPAAKGAFEAQAIYAGDAGVWYAHVDQVVTDYAPPEVIACDDKGRILVLTVYSGNWTAHSCVADGQWLAPSRPADVDPRLPGREIYAAGRSGTIHQVTLRPQPFARFSIESREIGHVAAEEFHTVLAADLSPAPGAELLAFAIGGPVYRLAALGDDGGFSVQKVGDVGGRVRDALVTRLPGGGGPTILGVSRNGDLIAMRLGSEGLGSRVLLHEDQGLGRVAAGRASGVYYVTRDDGLLLRIAVDERGEVERQPILATDQGLRGVAAGNFFADGREAVAVYGYGKVVQLVSRAAGGAWQVEDIYTGAQKGHWLTVGELDGRNGTDELIASGFDGEIVLLSRPKGYGLTGIAVPAPQAPPAPRAPTGVIR